MNQQLDNPHRRELQQSEHWQRLRWDDEDWSRHHHRDVDETLQAIVHLSQGRELQTIVQLLDLIDEDVYSNDRSVTLEAAASPVARAIARELNHDNSPEQGLRAGLAVATTLAQLVRGLTEIALSANHAWSEAQAD